ncbi:hypothetical protein FM104_06855 [Microbacterium esteraromaticum]|uniref:Integral membrane protein n=1 Tax=Microbacterium esteraromaticum TaxID=57043 RepID=A0A1R4JDV9_9MICO|nr:hypothetical protein [Microbacterium esteraromaticum]SJN30169.1 hypothetical protein FM104_06855 [Microbacterium esteraromaticum]
MYILLALISACALGVGLHYLMPHRELRGVAVTPAIATAVAAAVYTIMQWSGVGEGNVWLWVASIGGALVVSAIFTATISAQRIHHDTAAKQALGI